MAVIYWNSSFCHFDLNLLRSNRRNFICDIKFIRLKQRFGRDVLKLKKVMNLGGGIENFGCLGMSNQILRT
jgi:hypothetical protein